MLEWAHIRPLKSIVIGTFPSPGIVDKATGQQLVINASHIGEDDKGYEYSDPLFVLRLSCHVTGFATMQEAWDIDLSEIRHRSRLKRGEKRAIPRRAFDFVRAALPMLSKRPDKTIALTYMRRFLQAEEAAG